MLFTRIGERREARAISVDQGTTNVRTAVSASRCNRGLLICPSFQRRFGRYQVVDLFLVRRVTCGRGGFGRWVLVLCSMIGRGGFGRPYATAVVQTSENTVVRGSAVVYWYGILWTTVGDSAVGCWYCVP